MKLISPLLGLMATLAITSYSSLAAMPKSEILLADVNTEYGLQVSRITDGDVYNNQPLLTKSGIYFTKEVQNNEQSQTELVFYNFADQQTTNLTNTAVSEYSPTLTPDGSALSAIVVEANGKQKLWQYPFDKNVAPRRIFEWVEPVGYHAWGINNDVVMFILGKPHTLQYTHVAAAKPEVVASDIGRTLTFNKQLGAYTFNYTKQQQQWLASFDAKQNQVTDLFRLPKSVQDYTFKGADTVIYAVDNRVYQRNLSEPEIVSLWLDLTPYCETKITRMSYLNNQLAFVCTK
ncbi:hypothetical protein HH219_20480 [Pseudoalteromonas sp. NEC-BIFX-2020_015]|uniref:hypothetical protein n=1 Tax=Pseudoalteromonas sp. NEC-BIFX-2020_015 TaxID=2729544 RepID=UPI0014616836|nr:hypothetical protein [Pseudoalteromonas sp. NEC-BIFX-2020_015]NMR27881.1 hypothetical protein [Pseudoalteromonas sp. NEC-BIFX-2020_015]